MTPASPSAEEYQPLADRWAGALLYDHLRRVITATRGFEVAGRDWIMPWLVYLASPLVSRLLPASTARFRSFSARLGEGDLYVFANLFEDYRSDLLRSALSEVSCVIDAGANVGAFSWLAMQTARDLGCEIRITAIEPAEDNVAFLRSQPFARQMKIIQGAVGVTDGFGKLKAGVNSVTHRVESSSEGLAVFSLPTLCQEPVLLKMDIEGAELGILQAGLPENVRSMFLEWHPGPEDEHRPADPENLVPGGEWFCLSRDIYGASCWFWRRSEQGL